MSILNGKIIRTSLGTKDAPCFTCWIFIETEEGTGGVGGYALDAYNKRLSRREGIAEGLDAIMSILKTVGVDQWEDLTGQYVRCETDRMRITKIGHITKDKWFSFKESFQAWEEEHRRNPE